MQNLLLPNICITTSIAALDTVLKLANRMLFSNSLLSMVQKICLGLENQIYLQILFTFQQSKFAVLLYFYWTIGLATQREIILFLARWE